MNKISCEEKILKIFILLGIKKEIQESFLKNLENLSEKEKEKILQLLLLFTEEIKKKKEETLKKIKKINREISEVKNENEEEKTMEALEEEIKNF